MDAETETTAEIAATNGALEAEALEAKVDAAESVKEAMQATVQVPVIQEPVPVASVTSPTPKEAAKKPEAAASKAESSTDSIKQAVKDALKETEDKRAQGAPVKEQELVTSKPGEKHELTTAAFKALKQKAEEKGRKAAMEDISKELAGTGFTSLGEALRAVKEMQASALRTQQTAAPTPAPVAPVAPAPVAPPVPAPTPQQAAPEREKQVSLEAELRRANKERERLAQALAEEKARSEKENRRSKQLSKKVEAMEVDNELREAAIKTGVVDVDYAMTLLQRDLASKTEAQLASFDEKQYFNGLRNTHGYLFGERSEPANTSRTTDAPAAPSASQTQRQVVNQVAKKDASREKTEAVHARIREMGLTLPTS